MCSPTRAGLLTGRYQQRHGHDLQPGRNDGLWKDEPTIADAFRAGGYATGAVDKWNLGVLDEYHPQRRGFDDFVGFLPAVHDYLTEVWGREAVRFVEHHGDRPYFLYLAFNAVHNPL